MTEAPRHRWYHVALSLIFIVFCLELGMFLVIFPWSDFWERSLFLSIAPGWRVYWDNAYLRGAISGLGIVNVYISLVEIFRLRRFARSHNSEPSASNSEPRTSNSEPRV